MKRLIVKSVLIALVIGVLETLVMSAISLRPGHIYPQPIREQELRSYDNRTVAELEAFLKSRERPMTRYETLRFIVSQGHFWIGSAESSFAHAIAVFLGCFLVFGIGAQRLPDESLRI